jgi:hypothetical protein
MLVDLRLGAVLVLAACAPSLGALSAQQPGCTAALEAAGKEKSGDQYIVSVNRLPSCGDAGAQALAAQFVGPPKDSSALAALVNASYFMRDQRILNEVRQAVAQPSTPENARLAGLQILVSYFDPSIRMTYRPHPVPSESGALYVFLGGQDHPNTRPGPRPLGPNVRQDILATLKGMATSGDPTAPSTKVARYLGTRLSP